ncbi:hypothetical protein PG993_012248 [Apiospora rasikravindrae]|uniref:Extracellular membrane protein CFEM domain-containing protein n=1 Tax=Apiospora rasikravindrae TaxID=990691 RepID=A0ABR1S1X8_9PEZI
MKTSTMVAVLAPSVASAQWWNGAPECAHTCLSSAYAAATSASSTSGNNAPFWPAQSDYCNSDKGKQISSCLASGCKATPTAVSSYAKLSSSLCSQWAECTSAGSTGIHTVTLPGGPVTWGAPGGWGPSNGPNGGSHNFGPGGNGGFGGNQNWGGNNAQWSEWASAYSGSKTWTGGVVTVTGCMNDGSPWFSGPGCGWNDRGGFNGWVGWGNGWKWGATETSTVTITTKDANNNNAVTTFTGLATVAAAISGDLTTSTTIGIATSTGSANGNGAARIGGSPVGASEGSMVTGMMGIALGAVIVIAGML